MISSLLLLCVAASAVSNHASDPSRNAFGGFTANDPRVPNIPAPRKLANPPRHTGLQEVQNSAIDLSRDDDSWKQHETVQALLASRDLQNLDQQTKMARLMRGYTKIVQMQPTQVVPSKGQLLTAAEAVNTIARNLRSIIGDTPSTQSQLAKIIGDSSTLINATQREINLMARGQVHASTAPAAGGRTATSRRTVDHIADERPSASPTGGSQDRSAGGASLRKYFISGHDRFMENFRTLRQKGVSIPDERVVRFAAQALKSLVHDLGQPRGKRHGPLTVERITEGKKHLRIMYSTQMKMQCAHYESNIRAYKTQMNPVELREVEDAEWFVSPDVAETLNIGMPVSEFLRFSPDVANDSPVHITTAQRLANVVFELEAPTELYEGLSQTKKRPFLTLLKEKTECLKTHASMCRIYPQAKRAKTWGEFGAVKSFIDLEDKHERSKRAKIERESTAAAEDIELVVNSEDPAETMEMLNQWDQMMKKLEGK